MKALAAILVLFLIAKLFDNGEARRLKEVAHGKRRVSDLHKRT